MTCIFCGSDLAGCRSKEHVLPQWALDEFGLRDELTMPTHFSQSGQVLSDRLHTYNGMVAGKVCQNCNSGWMSRLEVENKDLITALARGRRDTLDLQDGAAVGLARWAFKTALALHAASNYRRLVPVEHYRHLPCGDANLPSGVHVVGKSWPLPCAFSWAQSPSWWIHQPQRELSAEELQTLKTHGYKICLCLSHLLLLVAFNPLATAKVILWKYLHVPLYPRSGPVAWLVGQPQLPTDHPFKAVAAFHHSFGVTPT